MPTKLMSAVSEVDQTLLLKKLPLKIMASEQIINEINKIFIKILEDDSIVLNDNTTTNDIDAWDSLNHIQIITAIEKHYKIRFELNELLNFKDVGDLCNGIQKKIIKNKI
jgi:acyl carrier protein